MGERDRASGVKWNFAVLLVQGMARRVANELCSEKLVLPFLYTAYGGSVLYAGLFAPVVILARLAAQLLGSRIIEISRRTKGWFSACTALTAAVVFVLAMYSRLLPPAWLPIAFILASVLLGLGNGFGALVFQEMIGRVLPDRPRINLLFSIGASSGFVLIITTLLSQYIAGFEPATRPAGDQVHLIWTGATLFVVSSLTAMTTRETPRTQPTNPSAKPDTQNYLGSTVAHSTALFRLQWFRRFVTARVLFLSVEMAVPFFAVHAAVYHAATALSMTLFMISFSLGMIAGGLVWPRVSKRSLQLVMSLSALVACIAALLALIFHLFDALRSPLTHAAMIFCLAFGTQGTLDASTAYVIRSSTEDERPFSIAVSSLAAGCVGIAIALTAGLVARERGAIIAIMIMAALNITAAFYARTLPNVEQKQT